MERIAVGTTSTQTDAESPTNAVATSNLALAPTDMTPQIGPVLDSGIGLQEGTEMVKQKRHTAEQIIAKLRGTDVELGRGVPGGPSLPQARDQRAHLLWRKKCGGLKVDQAKCLEEPERENARLK